MDLAEKIKIEREKRGIKQVDMANALNLERSNYTRMENRGSKMTLDQIQGIAEVIGISVQELMGVELTKSEEKNDIGEKEEKDRKIENLEKRVVELEDRIKDKESIIAFKTDKIKENAKLAHSVIEQYVRSKTREYGLMIYMEIVEGDKKSLKLQGKPSEVYPMFESKGIGRFQGHVAERDLSDVIELAFENEFPIAETMYTITRILEEQSKMYIIWERVYYYIMAHKRDPYRSRIRAEENNKVKDVSHLSCEFLLKSSQSCLSFS